LGRGIILNTNNVRLVAGVKTEYIDMDEKNAYNLGYSAYFDGGKENPYQENSDS